MGMAPEIYVALTTRESRQGEAARDLSGYAGHHTATSDAFYRRHFEYN